MLKKSKSGIMYKEVTEHGIKYLKELCLHYGVRAKITFYSGTECGHIINSEKVIESEFIAMLYLLQV